MNSIFEVSLNVNFMNQIYVLVDRNTTSKI